MKSKKKSKKKYIPPKVSSLEEETARMAGECTEGSAVGALHESCYSGGGAPLGCGVGT